MEAMRNSSGLGISPSKTLRIRQQGELSVPLGVAVSVAVALQCLVSAVWADVPADAAWL